MTIFSFLLALGMGAAISIYLPMISQSARILGAPVLGNVPFFAIAFLSSVVLVFVTGHKLPTMAKLAEVPAWLFIAGVVSALMIFGSSYLVLLSGHGRSFCFWSPAKSSSGRLSTTTAYWAFPSNRSRPSSFQGWYWSWLAPFWSALATSFSPNEKAPRRAPYTY